MSSISHRYLHAPQALWVSGASSTFLIAAFQTAFGGFPAQSAGHVAVSYGFLLWLLVYFLFSSTRDDILFSASSTTSPKDIGFDVAQGTASLVAAGWMGFLEGHLEPSTSGNCIAATSAIFAIAGTAALLYRAPGPGVSQAEQDRVQLCRWFATAVSGASILASSFYEAHALLIAWVTLCLLTVALAEYIRVRSHWGAPAAATSAPAAAAPAVHAGGGPSALGVLFRATMTLVVIGAAIGLAWEASEPVAKNFVSSIDESTLVGLLGFGAALASVEKLVSRLPALKAWIRSGSGEGAVVYSIFVFTTTLPFLVAYHYHPGPKVKGPETLASEPAAFAYAVTFAKAGEPPVLDPPGAPPAVFRVPFFKEAGSCDAHSEEFRNGGTLDNSVKLFITELVSGLVHCGEATKPVRLRVRGFASSQPFKGCGDKVSDDLNLLVANERARAVVKEIRAAEMVARAGAPLIALDVDDSDWNSLGEMKSERGYEDRMDGEYSHERAILTRRADIQIVDAGGCAVRSALREEPPPLSAGTEASKPAGESAGL